MENTNIKINDQYSLEIIKYFDKNNIAFTAFILLNSKNIISTNIQKK